jgi:hypothetical protein
MTERPTEAEIDAEASRLFATKSELTIEAELCAKTNEFDMPTFAHRRALKLFDASKLRGTLIADIQTAQSHLTDGDALYVKLTNLTRDKRVMLRESGHHKLIALRKHGDAGQKTAAKALADILFAQVTGGAGKLDRAIKLVETVSAVLAEPKKRAGRTPNPVPWATYAAELDAMFVSVSNCGMTSLDAANQHCKPINDLTTPSPKDNISRKRRLVEFYNKRLTLRKEVNAK